MLSATSESSTNTTSRTANCPLVCRVAVIDPVHPLAETSGGEPDGDARDDREEQQHDRRDER